MAKKSYSRRDFALSRKYKKVFAAAGVATITALVGAAGYHVSNDISGASAIGTEIEFVAPQLADGFVRSPELDAKKESLTSNESLYSKMYRGEDSLPSYYNSHDYYNTYTRTKNQNTEGLCWLYSGSTALEYALEKNGTATSISPKHIDYQFVSASDAYKDADLVAGAQNPYYNRWLSVGGYERVLGDGGNDYTMLLALSNPYALVSEDSFTNVLKTNDNRLSSINKYEDIWGLDNYTSILTETENSLAYTVKQDYNQINNAENTDYIVTGIGEIRSGFYGASTAKTEAIKQIKSAIKQYGAAQVGTFFDMDNCGTYSFDDSLNLNVTIIDRTSSNYYSPCSGGHSMALIGWDDNWEYDDNGTTKTGAFIVQNSWGDTQLVNAGSEMIEVPANYYMSYDSYFDVVYFTDLDAYDTYDHYYSIDDYNTPTIAADTDEYIFEFTTDGDEKIQKITFNQNLANSLNYELYVSTTGDAADFVKVDDFTAKMGMTGYEFDSEVAVSGDFAIKLVDTYGDIDEDEYVLNILNVYTVDAEEGGEEEPEEPSDTGAITNISGRDHVAGDGVDFKFRIDYALDLFDSIAIDGVELATTAYKVESGSTKVAIFADFLDTLENGDHMVSVAFTNGHVVTLSFTVSGETPEVPDTSADDPEPKSGTPDTGRYTKSQDSALPVTLCAASVIVALAIVSGRIASRKRHHVDFRK